jgi:hypothetical protein
MLLGRHGFAIRSARPLIFCVRPTEYMWQWASEFIDNYLPRLHQQGHLDQEFIDQFRAELTQAEKGKNSIMITPLVLEIIAQRL